MDKKRDLFLTLAGVGVAVIILIVLLSVLRTNRLLPLKGANPTPSVAPIVTEPFGNMKKFATDQEFKEYMQQSNQSTAYGGMAFSGSTMQVEDRAAVSNAVGGKMAAPMAAGGSAAPERVSQTNTQVLGIDEPDIVKTDGNSLYYSSAYRLMKGRPVPVPMGNSVIQPMQQTMIKTSPMEIAPDMYPIRTQGAVVAVRAFPPSSLATVADIDATGDLLLSKNNLIVFNEQNWSKRTVEGYDVSNPAKPVKKWSIPYKQNTSRVEARLFQNKLYLVSRYDMGGGTPCPVVPFDLKSGILTIPCHEIYHPSVAVNNDAVYTVARISPDDGKIETSVSFVGSNAQTTVYMSREAVYLTYHYTGDLSQIMYSFVSENGDLFDATVVSKLAKLQGYDLSQEAKMTELSSVIGRFMNTMDQDKRLTFETNMQNRAKKFMALHARELDKTGIVKVNADNLDIAATGSVPGQVLNQYSLDEYDNNLRIATTIGQSSWLYGVGNASDSFSDVYMLDAGLRERGSVRDLGKKERIYSVRFMANRGYVVTFRQTDPFYVLDLSNPGNPQLKGELKIPGYSSYLHPLAEDIILGIGRDEGNVKLSLFNVKDPTAPQEVDNFQLSEYWSEALDNPHAFLTDSKHNVFFMPGSKGGYVFSYAGNKIALAKAVADIQVQRAAYINNYLYIIGQNNIVVLDEGNWTKTAELSL